MKGFKWTWHQTAPVSEVDLFVKQYVIRMMGSSEWLVRMRWQQRAVFFLNLEGCYGACSQENTLKDPGEVGHQVGNLLTKGLGKLFITTLLYWNASKLRKQNLKTHLFIRYLQQIQHHWMGSPYFSVIVDVDCDTFCCSGHRVYWA